MALFLCLILVVNALRQAGELWQKSKRFFENLNLFPSIPPATDDHEIRNQRISTRLFIILLMLSMTVLLLYTSLITVTKTNSVERPNLEQYSQLYSTYSQTLTCSCSKISINYRKFIRIQYTLHQVCNSIFVDEKWIFYLLAQYGNILFAEDFRWASPYAFKALRTFCKVINSTIFDSLTRFYSNQYVSAFVTPLHIFETQTQSLIDQFKSSTINRFLLFHSMIRGTTQGNSLLSGKETNYKIQPPNHELSLLPATQEYDGCACSYSSTCRIQSHIYKYPDPTSLFHVPGFYAGCYVTEALLQSTLQCFYNQTCINDLQTYIRSWTIILPRAIDSSASTRYSENSSINELLDNLMIEEWNPSRMYDEYYDACLPKECTYVIEVRNDIIYIVTTLFGITGGLITILKLIVPRLVKLIRKKKEPSRPITSKSKLEKVILRVGVRVAWGEKRETMYILSFYTAICSLTTTFYRYVCLNFHI
jgi:hypothetical protein